MIKRIHYILFTFLIITNISFAQISEASFKKIDPQLYQIVSKLMSKEQTKTTTYATTVQTEAIRSLDKSGNEVYEVVLITNNSASLLSNGIPFNSKYDNFVTARLTPEQIVAAAGLESVKFISAGEIYYPNNDIANGLIGSDLVHAGYINGTSYTGNGVIVCIIDTGIDWQHLDFRDPTDNTKSRILYIWDQTLTDDGDEDTPFDRGGADFSGLNYGVEYTNALIENELNGSPTVDVREEDTHGHGTHVAGTAAGNGATLTSMKYAGIAPEADILVVKAGNGSFSDANIINALSYAQEVAADEGKAIVVNMSLGGHSNAHDDTSPIEQAVDAFVDIGRVAVISAGNEGSSAIHISGTLPASGGGNATINISVPTYTPNTGTDNDYFSFKLWLDDGTSVSATATSPAVDNSISHTQNAGTFGTGSVDTDGSIYLENLTDANNSDRYIYLRVDDNDATKPPQDGTWTLEISNNSASSVDYHGWLYSSSMGASLPSGNTNYTVGSPGTANEAITVGSYVSRWRWYTSSGGTISYGAPDYSDDISTFSSIGPTRAGNQKPDITAAGQAIISATSQSSTVPADYVVSSNYRVEQGTSMSSPVVAGAVALLLEENGSLSGSDIKTLLTGNTDTDTYTGGSLPDYTWGYGKINIFNSLAKSINSSWTPNQEILSYDEWGSEVGVAFDPNDLLSVRFSPSISGSITGVFFHASTTNTLTSDIFMEIWSDDGSGSPDSKLGSTVTFSKDNLLLYSWNYLDMTGAGVTVTSGTDYHIILYYTSGTNGAADFAIRADNASVDGRSKYSVNSGSSWTTQSFDWRMRAIVSEESSALPVELVAFEANVVENKVNLSWETATEVNNYGFDVERRINEDDESNQWQKIGFVEGHGTSASPKNYTYMDENPPANKLEYRLKQIDIDGTYEYYNLTAKVDASTVTGVDEIIPTEFALHQNYPNPFNPSTKIKFDLPERSNVSINIYNVIGQKIRTITSGIFDAGFHEVNFNANGLTSNIYFYRIETDENIATKKMIVLK